MLPFGITRVLDHSKRGGVKAAALLNGKSFPSSKTPSEGSNSRSKAFHLLKRFNASSQHFLEGSKDKYRNTISFNSGDTSLMVIDVMPFKCSGLLYQSAIFMELFLH